MRRAYAQGSFGHGDFRKANRQGAHAAEAPTSSAATLPDTVVPSLADVAMAPQAPDTLADTVVVSQPAPMLAETGGLAAAPATAFLGVPVVCELPVAGLGQGPRPPLDHAALWGVARRQRCSDLAWRQLGHLPRMCRVALVVVAAVFPLLDGAALTARGPAEDRVTQPCPSAHESGGQARARRAPWCCRQGGKPA